MGQILDKLQDLKESLGATVELSPYELKVASGAFPCRKEWRRKQIRKITDRVFDGVKNETGRANLKFEDLYIAVLIVYNDINKLLPGPHFDPPPKDKVREMMQNCDLNLDGEIDREEFYTFIKQLTADTFTIVSQKLIITLAVAPAVALATKRSTEKGPWCRECGAKDTKFSLCFTCDPCSCVVSETNLRR